MSERMPVPVGGRGARLRGGSEPARRGGGPLAGEERLLLVSSEPDADAVASAVEGPSSVPTGAAAAGTGLGPDGALGGAVDIGTLVPAGSGLGWRWRYGTYVRFSGSMLNLQVGQVVCFGRENHGLRQSAWNT